MILLDVRTKEEYDIDHIPGAILCDIMNLLQGDFPDIDKNEEIILYCESGNRSMMAKNMLDGAGFTNVVEAGSIDNLRK